MLFVVWGPQLYGKWLQGFWIRVPEAVFNVYLGILIYYFWGKVANRTDLKPLWECTIAVVFITVFSPFKTVQGAMIVLVALLLLPWEAKNWPCFAFKLLGRASFDVFLAQKVFFSTRFPARLALKYGFTEWGLFWVALLVGLVFYLIETTLYKILILLFKRVKNVRQM